MTTPTNLPPSVAALRTKVAEALDVDRMSCWPADREREVRNALDNLCLLAARAADPAPVADEAAIAPLLKREWGYCLFCSGSLDTGFECNDCGADLLPIVKALRARLPARDDGRLRKLREEMQAAWLACIENKKQFPVGSGDRRECQAEANAFQSVCFGIDKILAESPAGDAVKEIAAHAGGEAVNYALRLAAAETERDDAIRDRDRANTLAEERAKTCAALAKERDAAKDEYRILREELDAHIEARQNCKHILVGESAVDAVDRLAKERDWERHEWPKQIAAALHTEAGRIGATPSMVATAVQLEHEAHTKCFERLVKAKDELAAAKAEGAKAAVDRLGIARDVVCQMAERARITHPNVYRSLLDAMVHIDERRAAQPQPAPTCDPDTLRKYLDEFSRYKADVALVWLQAAVAELCRGRLDGKP